MRGLINWIKQNPILFIAYVCVGIGLFVLGKFLYLISETYNIGGNLTPEEMAQTGQVGDFIGGVIGSIWALAGVFLYFSALKLQQQELKSQREEMATSQKLLDQQLFEGTFFNLLKAQENIRNGIHAYFLWINIDNYSRIEERKEEKHGVNFFAFAKSQLDLLHHLISNYDLVYCTLESLQENLDNFNRSHDFNENTYFYDMQELYELKLWTRLQYLSIRYPIDINYFNQKRRKEDVIKKVTYIYWLFYSRYEFCLSHYCRHFYNLVKFLDDYNNKLLSEVGEDEQEKRSDIEHKINNYLSFIQSSMSSSELVALYYNMLLFPKANALYAKYNVFENLNVENLIDKSHATFFPNIRLKSEDDLKSRFLTEDEMINE